MAAGGRAKEESIVEANVDGLGWISDEGAGVGSPLAYIVADKMATGEGDMATGEDLGIWSKSKDARVEIK